MKKRNQKRGFTVVELVVVVTVIAILSAVLIPTFSGIIKKSRESADQQAVRQMNVLLQTYDTEEFSNVSEVIDALMESDVNLDDYKPLSKDTYFYWVEAENRIVMADATNAVLYPADLKDVETSGWWSLSGEVPMSDGWKNNITAGVVTIDNAAQLASLMDAITNDRKAAKNVTEIKLAADIDMMGSAYTFRLTKDADRDIVFDGNGKTISNFRSDVNSYAAENAAGVDSVYGYGLFSYVPLNSSLTIKNLTVSGAVVGASSSQVDTGSIGVLVGNVKGNLTVSNVKVTDALVFGEKKVGGAIGYVGKDGGDQACNLTINGLTMENVTVTGGREVATVVGFIDTDKVDSYTATGIVLENVIAEADPFFGYTYNADKSLTTAPAEKAGITQNHYFLADKTAHNFS